ncbi:STAS domain-containing protein [Plantactinospora alkalitolerans]|uniref:STAS domain-containing protein n=1 Tax=Plantactinospora alkalitolerans TaxID=2789879 RepID=UPI0018ACE841|nr:STAS domain-containing protein [Plantactinospora alkalitolerans]
MAFDARRTTTAPAARPGMDILRDSAGVEPPFFVARYIERTNPSASISADRLVVVPAGYVDMDTAPVLESALVNAVDSHPEVCCDLAAAGFFSAAGIGVLLVAHDRAGRSGSRFSIRGAHGITRRVLRITQVDRLLVDLRSEPRRATTRQRADAHVTTDKSGSEGLSKS